MLLSDNEFIRLALKLSKATGSGAIAFDFETDGLDPRKGARAFIMGFAYQTDQYEGVACVRLEEHLSEMMRLFFANRRMKYLAHNAKFEMAFLKHQWGIQIEGDVWDTEVFARLENNSYQSYSLQNCAQRIGMTKHVPMLEWLKKRGNKNKYHMAPDELIIPYVEQDAALSLELYKRQRKQLIDWTLNSPQNVNDLVKLEMKTTKNLFAMEEAGLVLDVAYCEAAQQYEAHRQASSARKFQELTGVPFVDSRKTLQPLFDKLGISYAKTELGNASFTSEVLEPHKDHPVVAEILAHRGAIKRGVTYWDNFLALHNKGVIYPSIRQSGTATGRFSAYAPNVQNWPTDDDDPAFPIRRAFLAKPGCKIVSIDYAQMEYRLVADEARAVEVIDQIKAGKDFHQAVADIAGVDRFTAKTINFARLYGAGTAKIAHTLGVSEDRARAIIQDIDRASGSIGSYTRQLIDWAQTTHLTWNWLGRRYYFDSGFEYKCPNYIIQGGCSDILRYAIDDVLAYLRANCSVSTQLLIPIHDELVFNFQEEDLKHIPEVRKIMIAAHRNKRMLDMDVSISVGDNFHDLEEWHD